jgi:tRNA 2-thiouridine synthesizing protein D
MGDGVHAARAGQEPRDAHASLEQMLVGLLDRGVGVVCCGTCCRTRGVTEGDLVDGVTLATIRDLAESVVQCERTLSF